MTLPPLFFYLSFFVSLYLFDMEMALAYKANAMKIFAIDGGDMYNMLLELDCILPFS